MKKTIRVVKTFKIVKRSCSLNRYYRVVIKFWENLFMNVPFPSPSRWWWCYYCCWLTFFISHSKDWLSGILPFWQFRQSHLLYRIPINLALADRTVLRIVTLSTRGFVDMSRHPTDTKKQRRCALWNFLNSKSQVECTSFDRELSSYSRS